MSYAQLTLEERFTIYHLKLFKLSVREIARRLNRHHSTVSRELQRNGPRYVGVYWAVGAQHRAEQRRQRARHQRRGSNAALCQYVMQRLQAHWSPEAIEGRLMLDFPADASMRLSHEAIYRWLYLDRRPVGSYITACAGSTSVDVSSVAMAAYTG